MNTLGSVHELLQRTARRRRLQRGWNGLWFGLLAGIAAALAALATYKLAPVPREWLAWIALPIVAGPIVGFLLRWLPRISESEAARWLDQKQGLQERISTALEFAGRPASEGFWSRLVVADATQAASAVDPRRLLPWTVPSIWRWVLTGAVALVGLGFAPEYRSKAYVQQKKDAEIVKDTGKQLALLTRKNLTDRKPALEQTQKSLEKIAELGEHLNQARLTRSDALKDLASATEKLKQEATSMAQNPALRRLEQAARTPGNTATQGASSLQKQIDALQKQLGDKEGRNGDAMNQLQKDLQALKDAAKGLGDKDGAKGDAARSQLAQMAAELARKAESTGMPLPSLDEAVAALNAAQVEQFLRDLNTAEQDLQKMADMARQLAQLQQQAEKLGKDLAEQLKNGQAQAAVESLQQMRQLVTRTDLKPEQRSKILKELADALKPAEQYGKVAEFLKSAAAKLKDDEKETTDKALASAQKELQEMLEQMGDMEGLMATLQNLQKAQMCIGNGLSWGQCQGGGAGGSGKPRGKGRRGFGDWSEDDPWAMPSEISDSWDNSGLTRGDKESRGLTERDSSTPDNIAPTKIKGQIQPGGPMPSITLKGISIKGNSTVAYTEAVAASQVEAQAALNQDKVPRAYQNAVRSYFDDSKAPEAPRR